MKRLPVMALYSHRKSTGSTILKRLVAVLLVVLALVGAVVAAHADSEIVVAIRYLTPTGTSHAHIYLYREDGKLLRQLTNDDSGQDRNPQFAPDGETIVFTRLKPKAGLEYWGIGPRGDRLMHLTAPPAWYTNTSSSAYFTNTDINSGSATPPATPTYRSPDGAVELVLREPADDPTKDFDGPGHGTHFLLRALASGHETEMGKLPGYVGLYSALHDNKDPSKHFLFEGKLRIAFFALHLGSSDGDTVFALDLTSPRLVQLSPNWAAPYPLEDEPAFLTDTEVRYVPFGSSGKTANSSYIEHWDSALRKIRYAHPGAAITYGASMYRPGRTPAIVTIHSDAGD